MRVGTTRRGEASEVPANGGQVKRSLRILFNIVTAVSLLLCIATAVLWVRSYVIGDEWVWYDRTCSECPFDVRTGDGRWQYTWADVRSFIGELAPAGHATHREPGKWMMIAAPSGSPHYAIPGLRFDRYSPLYWCLQGSFAIPFIVTAAIPLLWLARARLRRKLKEAGCCPTCGYDLRATPDRCPECGTIP